MTTPKAGLTADYRQAARFWWSFTWRTFVWFWALVIPLGIVVALLRMMGMSPSTAGKLASTLAWPLIFAAQIEAIRRVLNITFAAQRHE